MRSVYKRNYHIVSAYVRAGENSELAKKYNIRWFPRLVFVDHKGQRLCTGSFSHVEDGLELDRFIQKIHKDPNARAELVVGMTCGRLSS